MVVQEQIFFISTQKDVRGYQKVAPGKINHKNAKKSCFRPYLELLHNIPVSKPWACELIAIFRIAHSRNIGQFKILGVPSTLESGIDVGQGINVGPGKFVKKNKRRALNKCRAWTKCAKLCYK